MKDFWANHRWPVGERRLHWLVVFDTSEDVKVTYSAHLPILRVHDRLIDVVPLEWLHLTLLSLCPMGEVSEGEFDQLRERGQEALAVVPAPKVQLGPARIDGGAVTWAVHPEDGLEFVHRVLRDVSLETLGAYRVRLQRTRWSPHVTLGYGKADDSADDLAAALAQSKLPRANLTIAQTILADLEQDPARREYRWNELAAVRIAGKVAAT